MTVMPDTSEGHDDLEDRSEAEPGRGCDLGIPGAESQEPSDRILDTEVELAKIEAENVEPIVDVDTLSKKNSNIIPHEISDDHDKDSKSHLNLSLAPPSSTCPPIQEPSSPPFLYKSISPQESPHLFGWSPRLLLAISVVLLSCCCNVIFLELLVRQDPGIGNLVTAAQFLVIAVEGFFLTTRCGTVGPKVPFRSWLVLVVMYFLVSVTNNYALSYNIPMPLHMVFRAGSLMANMVMGMVLLGKRYKTVKYVSVVMITIGIATCTVMSATSRVSLKTGKAVFTKEGESGEAAVESLLLALEDEQTERRRELMTGIALMALAMFMSARMGIYQEVVYSKHGKHPKEALFYTHALPLPGFLLLGPDILHHWQICWNSPLVQVPGLALELPSMVLHLIGNVVPQYLCITAVFVLTAECSSLTATLVLTFRKFLSLLFSIWYFQNPFSTVHWIGTSLVFGGIILFSDIPALLRKKNKQD